MSSQLLERPELEELDTRTGHWVVIVYDNDYNTWDEVMDILMKATGCTQDEAYTETWEIDRLGKSVVHHGSEDECTRAAGIIRTIGIRVEVAEE
jgi:ATP-dependent Clp protease adaptor protein ClpS